MTGVAAQTLTVTVPFTIRRRGGRKEIVVPEGVPLERRRIDNTLVKALARAFRWKKMIDTGAFATVGDLAVHEKMPPSYLTRIMRLTLLAPVIVEALIEGRAGNPTLADLMDAFPAQWALQTKQLK